MAFRASQFFAALLCLLLASSLMLCQATSMHGRHAASGDVRSFDQKVQSLRKLAAREQESTTRRLIESLDELDDLELSQLHGPKRSLTQGPGYGTRRQTLQAGGTYPSQRRRYLQAGGTYPPTA